jgi:hypothetical protein
MKSIKLKQDMEKYKEALDNHLCRFNDGELACDCFVEGFKVGFNQETKTCTCKIDKESKLTIDNKCYWHRK